MKKTFRTPLAVLGLLLTAALWGFALLAGDGLPGWAVGLITGAGGALGGCCLSILFMEAVPRRFTPEQRRELERGEKDERNIAIREKAAQSSWYWSLYLLWGLFILCLVLHQPLYIALSSAVIVLHCLFYLVNVGRWSKRL